MTAQFDGYESQTLFNSMQEGGQGVFSLMVDLRAAVQLDGSTVARAQGAEQELDAERHLTVGQELNLALTQDSVSPSAADVTVVWSNGYIGPSYAVRPEDIGTTLTATATFAGEDMRPLEVTVEYGDVVRGPAPQLDLNLLSISGEGAPAEKEVPDSGIVEALPALLLVQEDAFSPCADSIDVTWMIGGVSVGRSEGVRTQNGYFTAKFTPEQGTAGSSLTVVLDAHRDGAESSSVRINAGWIGKGTAIALKDNVIVRVFDPVVGEKSTARIKKSDFTPTASSLSFQWMSNDQAIEGETSKSIVVTPELRGRSLSVLVEASGEGALSTTVDIAVGIVGLGDAPEYLGEQPTIKGKARVGNTLRLANFERVFIEPEADSVEIQWMRGKDAIPGARGKTYEVREADLGEKISARILLRKLGHKSSVLRTEHKRVK